GQLVAGLLDERVAHHGDVDARAPRAGVVLDPGAAAVAAVVPAGQPGDREDADQDGGDGGGRREGGQPVAAQRGPTLVLVLATAGHAPRPGQPSPPAAGPAAARRTSFDRSTKASRIRFSAWRSGASASPRRSPSASTTAPSASMATRASSSLGSGSARWSAATS